MPLGTVAERAEKYGRVYTQAWVPNMYVGHLSYCYDTLTVNGEQLDMNVAVEQLFVYAENGSGVTSVVCDVLGSYARNVFYNFFLRFRQSPLFGGVLSFKLNAHDEQHPPLRDLLNSDTITAVTLKNVKADLADGLRNVPKMTTFAFSQENVNQQMYNFHEMADFLVSCWHGRPMREIKLAWLPWLVTGKLLAALFGLVLEPGSFNLKVKQCNNVYAIDLGQHLPEHVRLGLKELKLYTRSPTHGTINYAFAFDTPNLELANIYHVPFMSDDDLVLLMGGMQDKIERCAKKGVVFKMGMRCHTPNVIMKAMNQGFINEAFVERDDRANLLRPAFTYRCILERTRVPFLLKIKGY